MGIPLPLLRERRDRAMETLRSCRLCPRECGANRLAGESGFCRANGGTKVASVSLHHGEEPPISGTSGSGTVFFSHCNMSCLFCQNYPISQMGVGERMTPVELGDRLLDLERKGAHNVNFVTPTPHVPQMLDALLEACGNGFSLPVLYNTNGYDSMETLSLVDGIVDIYLPDMKYRTEELSVLASETPGYPVHNARAVAEMIRQVGPLDTGADGIARRGVLIRHLVLPGKVEETERVLSFIREEYGKETPISLMGQYFPAHRAGTVPGFTRKLRQTEYGNAVEAAVRLGLVNVYIQEI
ncbi:MAG: radical SAM protein [Deltaproteobacteria bacterium]|nr:radical SAM protein [Deltaproteobacteria bacterium]